MGEELFSLTRWGRDERGFRWGRGGRRNCAPLRGGGATRGGALGGGGEDGETALPYEVGEVEAQVGDTRRGSEIGGKKELAALTCSFTLSPKKACKYNQNLINYILGSR